MRAPSELSVEGGKKWEGSGRTPTFDRDQRRGDYTLGERGVFVEKENGVGLAGNTVTEERFQVAGTRVSSVTGWSGEQS